MSIRDKAIKKAERCAYLKVCFLAEELKCFGYMTDCALYQKSNGEDLTQERFNEAMDRLINKTMVRHQKILS